VKGYHDVSRHPDARCIPGLVLLRWDAPLFFANAEIFHERVLQAVHDAPTTTRWIVIAAEPVTDRPARHEPACLIPTPPSPPAAPPFKVDPRCPADPAHGPPQVPVGHVAFPESKDAPKLEVELMLTKEHRERGLMYRKNLADDKGMLFGWNSPTVQTFWMHNTCIPLDMLYITKEGIIAGILEQVPTLNDAPRGIKCPVAHVLELNAGWARAHGLAPGMKLKIEG